MEISLLEPLRERLSKPLPGLEAQLKMAGGLRKKKYPKLVIPDNARQSAVLLLLYPEDGALHAPMILRQSYPGTHSGQIGLPGGSLEPEDNSYMDAALRETEEEIGVSRGEIEVLGQLTELYIPPSNFLVKPFVGTIARKPAWIPEVAEVAELIETPISAFLNPQNIGEAEVPVMGGLTMQVPRYLIKGHTVWGATAMMMSEFSAILEEL